MASAARPSANVAKAFASIPGSPCDGVFFFKTLPRLLLLHWVLLDHLMVLMEKRKWMCDEDVDTLLMIRSLSEKIT